MFCALSQNNQHLFKNNMASYCKLFKELKNGIEIQVSQAVFKIDRNNQNVVWINIPRTAWPTLILMLFLSSLDNLLSDAYILFFKRVWIILR